MMHRRRFLSDLTKAAALCAAVPNSWQITWHPTFADDPFALGVASGDPTPTGAVIWTRLAPRPFEPEGGMPGNRPIVDWEVADDEQFTRIVRKGRYTAAPELSYSVHVDVEGLEADRWYFYRFRSGGAVSPIGRMRTSPADGAMTPLRFGMVSCQNYEQGLYTAYQHLAQERCDLITHLGDYIYEYSARAGAIRPHQGFEIRSLDQYRTRYAQYKLDPLLQAAHALCPWLVTWDDHEVDNNYADAVGENVMESSEQMRARRAAAYQAWWEHQPVRVPRAKSWADLTIRRSTSWGALARVWMLDTRQYRDDQACGDGTQQVPCGEWENPARSILGAEQERWLHEGLGASKSRWQVIGQQVPVASFDNLAGPGQALYMDGWGGYPASQRRLMQAIAERAPNRTVVLTGDVHANFVNELTRIPDRRESPVVAAEFIGTSISSGGDGSATWQGAAELAGDNPQVKWHSARRGYVMHEVTPSAWSATYREVPYVEKAGAPVSTAGQWRVEHGKAGITKA